LFLQRAQKIWMVCDLPAVLTPLPGLVMQALLASFIP
jgi:hypothetical protein